MGIILNYKQLVILVKRQNKNNKTLRNIVRPQGHACKRYRDYITFWTDAKLFWNLSKWLKNDRMTENSGKQIYPVYKISVK